MKLDHGILIKTTKAGLYEPAVSIGQWIEAGEVFARVLDYDGNVVEEITVPEAGTVLDVIGCSGHQGERLWRKDRCPLARRLVEHSQG